MNKENFTGEYFNHGSLPNSYDKWLILETEANLTFVTTISCCRVISLLQRHLTKLTWALLCSSRSRSYSLVKPLACSFRAAKSSLVFSSSLWIQDQKLHSKVFMQFWNQCKTQMKWLYMVPVWKDCSTVSRFNALLNKRTFNARRIIYGHAEI